MTRLMRVGQGAVVLPRTERHWATPRRRDSRQFCNSPVRCRATKVPIRNHNPAEEANVMTNNSFAAGILVDRSPMPVFDGSKRPCDWWGA
ncbi:hypothetical protein MES4922_190169 [Mesorhizobium ventifaucium]|uniref:Uncharacterized protein n=1 Tax=Mesorhizobium ventifaucium TaxID=666020 RepID=A0ABM9DLC6_9HYPH|nr:hypothetical protein MES4922_190169 [Mesorhizobium ventifaucium]